MKVIGSRKNTPDKESQPCEESQLSEVTIAKMSGFRFLGGLNSIQMKPKAGVYRPKNSDWEERESRNQSMPASEREEVASGRRCP
jgi:hypothetical protein